MYPWVQLADSKRKEDTGKLTTDIISVLQILMFSPIFFLCLLSMASRELVAFCILFTEFSLISRSHRR